MMKRFRVRVIGRVQGVFFRASTKRMAQSLGLKGWVKNLPDGSVEAIFEGKNEDLEEMLRWCRKGPPGAVVRNCRANEEPYSGDFQDFRISY